MLVVTSSIRRSLVGPAPSIDIDQDVRMSVTTIRILAIDGLQPTGIPRDVTVVDYGVSELEDVLANPVESMGRRLSSDPRPEAGGYFRSDHIPLAKRRVPMTSMGQALGQVDGMAAWKPAEPLAKLCRQPLSRRER